MSIFTLYEEPHSPKLSFEGTHSRRPNSKVESVGDYALVAIHGLDQPTQGPILGFLTFNNVQTLSDTNKNYLVPTQPIEDLV